MTTKTNQSATLNLYFNKDELKYLNELRRVCGLQYTKPNAKIRQYIREGLKNEPINQSLCMYYQ